MLALLPLLVLLTLLIVQKIFHLLANLFCLATQHLLLPSLLGNLVRIRLLLLTGQILLPARELIQLLHRVVYLLLLLLASRTRVSFILILFFIKLQIEQIGKIAAGATTATASAAATPAADLNLNIAERRLGPQ